MRCVVSHETRALLLVACLVVGGCGGPAAATADHTGVAVTPGPIPTTATAPLQTPRLIPPTMPALTPPPSVPWASVSPATPSTPTPSPVPSATPGVSGCTLAQPAPMVLPAELTGSGGFVAGLTADGDVLVLRNGRSGGSSGDIIREDLLLWHPGDQTASTVISRSAPHGQILNDQVYVPTGNARWIVWLQTDFYVEHANWTMWVLDRQSGDVRKLAKSDAGPVGLAAPSPISLLQNEAVWAAPITTASGAVESRLYVADLDAGSVRRLEPNANFPVATGPGSVTAAVDVGHDAQGRLLARPAVIDVKTGKSVFTEAFPASHVAAFSAGPAGMIVVNVIADATAEHPSVVAEVVVLDATGALRHFALPDGWGNVAVGDHLIAWLDLRHLWALPAGQESPTLVAESTEDNDNDIGSYGDLVLWRESSSDHPGQSIALLQAVCG